MVDVIFHTFEYEFVALLENLPQNSFLLLNGVSHLPAPLL